MSSRKGRPTNTDGRIYQRPGSAFWWMRYPDHDRKIHRESTGTVDEVVARRILRDRVSARDEGRLLALLAGKNLTFDQWANWYVEKRSVLRREKTHLANLNALKFLRPVFGPTRLTEIEIESYGPYSKEESSS